MLLSVQHLMTTTTKALYPYKQQIRELMKEIRLLNKHKESLELQVGQTQDLLSKIVQEVKVNVDIIHYKSKDIKQKINNRIQ